MSDLAILSFRPESELTTAKLGDSKNLAIGDWVIAIGSPFDLEATVSAGIISATGRSIERIVPGRGGALMRVRIARGKTVRPPRSPQPRKAMSYRLSVHMACCCNPSSSARTLRSMEKRSRS